MTTEEENAAKQAKAVKDAEIASWPEEFKKEHSESSNPDKAFLFLKIRARNQKAQERDESIPSLEDVLDSNPLSGFMEGK